VTQTCDVDVEVVGLLSMLVVDDALVGALVLLFESLNTQNDLSPML